MDLYVKSLSMFQHWLKGISEPVQLLKKQAATFEFGHHIDLYAPNRKLKEHQVALLGVGAGMDKIRSFLYRLSFPFKEASVIDLGNLKKQEPAFIIPILKELLAGKVFPILISSVNQHALAYYQAFRDVRPLISLGSIAEQLYFHPTAPDNRFFFNSIVHPKSGQSQLFNYTLIGGQAHFIDPRQLSYIEEKNFDYISLGNIRKNIQEVEPNLRDADLIHFHLNALKRSEAPGATGSSPSGLFHEEGCQLVRYAGMSDKLKGFGLFGYQEHLDQGDATAQSIAQLIWYFLDGFYNRKRDFPVSKEDLVEYVVEAKDLNNQMIFYRSNRSGRWWMQVPIKIKDNLYRHGLIPCSYKDYQAASKDQFPDRLIRAIQRFG